MTRGRATLTIDFGNGYVEEWCGELSTLDLTYNTRAVLTETRMRWHGEPARIAFQVVQVGDTAELVADDEDGR